MLEAITGERAVHRARCPHLAAAVGERGLVGDPSRRRLGACKIRMWRRTKPSAGTAGAAPASRAATATAGRGGRGARASGLSARAMKAPRRIAPSR